MGAILWEIGTIFILIILFPIGVFFLGKWLQLSDRVIQELILIIGIVFLGALFNILYSPAMLIIFISIAIAIVSVIIRFTLLERRE